MIRNTKYAAHRWSWLASAGLSLLALPASAEKVDCLLDDGNVPVVEVTVSPVCSADPSAPDGVNCCQVNVGADQFLDVYDDSGNKLLNHGYCQYAGNTTVPFGKGANSITLYCEINGTSVSPTCAGEAWVQNSAPPVPSCPALTYGCSGILDPWATPQPPAYDPCDIAASECEVEVSKDLWVPWPDANAMDPSKRALSLSGAHAYRCKGISHYASRSGSTVQWVKKESAYCTGQLSQQPPYSMIMADPPEKGVAMWPPNHKYWDQSVSACGGRVWLIQACEGGSASIRELTGDEIKWSVDGIMSSQYEDDALDAGGERGDGATCADAKVTGPDTFSLRAERLGTEKVGRGYRVGYWVRSRDFPDAVPGYNECRYTVAHSMSVPATPSPTCRYCVDGSQRDALLASWGAASSFCREPMTGCPDPSTLPLCKY